MPTCDECGQDHSDQMLVELTMPIEVARTMRAMILHSKDFTLATIPDNTTELQNSVIEDALNTYDFILDKVLSADFLGIDPDAEVLLYVIGEEGNGDALN